MARNVPDFTTLLRGARSTAVHLEMRDSYSATDDRECDVPLVRETVGRGVMLRRARIVSEPVTDCVRREHTRTPAHLAAGALVRWLPRPRASTIALPGNDFWLIDNRLVLFHWFTGDGAWAGHSFTGDPGAVKLCASAFAAVWERGVPHEQYAV
ncbi:DUF6879 family protein [Kitasatospora sp. GAS1066B]|uniref:DUF6879 family protein n=1 Tax=Kitasatospora sp. GAS1066B TaxID=3156271 RepID=UPI003515CFA8